MNGMSKAFLANAPAVLRKMYPPERKRRSRPRRYSEPKSPERIAAEKAERKAAKQGKKNKGKSQRD